MKLEARKPLARLSAVVVVLLASSCAGSTSAEKKAPATSDGGARGNGDMECVLTGGACPDECVEVRANVQMGPDQQCYVALDVLIGCVSADEVRDGEDCPGIAAGCIESPDGIRYIEGSCLPPRLEGFVDCDAEVYYESSQAPCEDD